MIQGFMARFFANVYFDTRRINAAVEQMHQVFFLAERLEKAPKLFHAGEL